MASEHLYSASSRKLQSFCHDSTRSRLNRMVFNRWQNGSREKDKALKSQITCMNVDTSRSPCALECREQRVRGMILPTLSKKNIYSNDHGLNSEHYFYIASIRKLLSCQYQKELCATLTYFKPLIQSASPLNLLSVFKRTLTTKTPRTMIYQLRNAPK